MSEKKSLFMWFTVTSIVIVGVICIAFILYNFFQPSTNHYNKLLASSQSISDSSLSSLNDSILNSIPTVNYQLDTVRSASQLFKIRKKYGWKDSANQNHKIFTLLNRKELRFVRVGSSVIIPDTIIADPLAYSVFPQFYKGAAELPKIIMVSNRLMAYACYEKGRLVRFAACNPGKERTPTYPGRYALNWKERVHRSSLDSHWLMPFTWNFHFEAGSAFHQFAMPGYPASHSCIRQFADDAEWLYSWGKGIRKDSNGRFIPLSGTPVIIIDHYDFSPNKGREWIRLKSNKDGLLTLPEKPMEVEEALIPICQIPHGSRGRLRNREKYETAEEVLRSRGVIRQNVNLIQTVNFNKVRRQKAAAKAAKEAQKQVVK